MTTIQHIALAYNQHGVSMSDHSESQHQLREAGHNLPAYVMYGYGDPAILLHPQVVELRGEFQDDVMMM